MGDDAPRLEPVPLATLDAIRGTVRGPGSWIDVTQARVDSFADATDDHQWIHVDAERAAEGPFGGTIAHGFLTLSLLSALVADVFEVTGAAMGINYGFDKVRFLAPVLVGSRVRALAEVMQVDDVPGGTQVRLGVQVLSDRSARPVCVAEWLLRYVAP